jgi:hypothetical protein
MRLTDKALAELWSSYQYGRDDGEPEDLTLWDIADVYRMGYETLDVMPLLLAEIRQWRAIAERDHGKPFAAALSSADLALIDQGLGTLSSDYNDVDHEAIAELRERLTKEHGK